jgi:hypothetical protein
MSRAQYAISGLGIVCGPVHDCGGSEPSAAAQGVDAWFDATPYLTPHEARFMTKAGQLAVAASTLALRDASCAGHYACGDIGVAIGTNFAATRVVSNIDAAVLERGAAAVRPLEAPYFSINLPASHVSIKAGLHAFNLTLTNPYVAGLDAIAVSCRSLARKRARLVVAGALEADPPVLNGAAALAKAESGACLVTLELAEALAQRDAGAYAIVRAYRSAFINPETIGNHDASEEALAVLDATIAPLLENALPPLIVAGPCAPHPVAMLVWTAIERALGRWGRNHEIWRGIGADGRHGSASPVLALASIASAGRSALIAAASMRGEVVFVATATPESAGLARRADTVSST